MIEVRKVHAFDDNYIWLIASQGSRRVTIVDPGEAEPVLARIERDGLEPEAILLTHHHGDHTAGVAELLARYPMPVYGPAQESIRHLSHPLREGDQLSLDGGQISLTVLDTPGHTRGHLSYYGEGALFCGDTLFTAGCGRLFEGSPEQMYASLEKLRALPDDTLVYCAHEYTEANLRFAVVAEPDNPDTQTRQQEVQHLRQQGQDTVPSLLKREKQTNPFLRCHLPALKQAAEAWAKHPLHSPSEVFATVRAWKDALD